MAKAITKRKSLFRLTVTGGESITAVGRQNKKLSYEVFNCRLQEENVNWKWSKEINLQGPPPLRFLLQQDFTSERLQNLP